MSLVIEKGRQHDGENLMEEMLRTVEEAMSSVIEWWGDLSGANERRNRAVSHPTRGRD
jgi:hypothetical protein